MSTFATLWQVLMAVFHLVVASRNACVVFAKVIQSAIEEAKQEAAELMSLLDDHASTLDMVTSPSLGYDTTHSENPWQMLIIARTSSFVLLLRLSKRRVLHLEVDEKFITSKLEVILTELTLHIQHVPRLLDMPIGTHDMRLVRYTPMKLPYLWKETTHTGIEGSTVAVVPVSCVGEGRTHRKKYVQLLAESTVRRRIQMDRLLSLEAPQKKGKKRALANATNMTTMNPDELTRGVEPARASKTRVERGIHKSRSENNMAEQLHRVAFQSLRRKRGQFDLYAQGVSSEFSLLPKS